jgi:hypothetical protein
MSQPVIYGITASKPIYGPLCNDVVCQTTSVGKYTGVLSFAPATPVASATKPVDSATKPAPVVPRDCGGFGSYGRNDRCRYSCTCNTTY